MRSQHALHRKPTFRHSLLLLILVSACLMIAGCQTPASPPAAYPYWPSYEPVPLAKIKPQPWRAREDIIEGWDWSLPASVQPSPRSLLGVQRIIGLTKEFEPVRLQFPANATALLWVKWRDLEPTEGNYRFDLVKARIQQANDAGWDVILRILTCSKSRGNDAKALARGDAPLWLEDFGVPLLPKKRPRDNLNFDPANPAFHERYIRLIDELAKSGIPQMVKAAYVGYASPSFGDEGIGPVDAPCVRERLDAWARAFNGMEYKVFMGGPSEYGFNKGFGVRRGFVEMYLYCLPSESLGQYLDQAGYVRVDEDSPILRRHCFNGEENEEYEPAWATEARGFRYGPTTESYPYRYFTSNLRLLQMRCTFVFEKDNLIPELLPFVALELGRTVDDAPDVWCDLRESYLRADYVRKHDWTDRGITLQEEKNGVPAKNFERWLYQRDLDDSPTTPVKRIDHPIRMWMVQDDKRFDYIARKGRRIRFTIDRRWLKATPTDVAVKITYFDEGEGALALHFPDGKQRTIRLTGDEKLKTATLFATVEAKDAEFEIHSGGDTPIAFVRVIKR